MFIVDPHILFGAGGGGGPSPFAPIASAKQITTGNPTPAIDTTGATLLVAYLVGSGAATLVDSKGNTWLLAGSTSMNGSQGHLYYAIGSLNVGSGHTAQPDSGSVTAIVFAAFGGPTAPVFDQFLGTANGSSPLNTGSLTPSEDGCLVIAGANCDPSGSYSIDDGFTILQSNAGAGGTAYSNSMAYKVQTTAAAENPEWTTGSTTNRAVIAAFKPA